MLLLSNWKFVASQTFCSICIYVSLQLESFRIGSAVFQTNRNHHLHVCSLLDHLHQNVHRRSPGSLKIASASMEVDSNSAEQMVNIFRNWHLQKNHQSPCYFGRMHRNLLGSGAYTIMIHPNPHVAHVHKHPPDHEQPTELHLTVTVTSASRIAVASRDAPSRTSWHKRHSFEPPLSFCRTKVESDSNPNKLKGILQTMPWED